MEKFNDYKLKMIFDQMPGCWGCKDINSVFLYANQEYGKIIGLKHNLDCIGRNDYDMPCATIECADLFRAQDKAVIASGKTMKILDIHPFAGNVWKAYIFTKTPLYDVSQQIIGTIFHGCDITSRKIIEIGSLLGKIALNNKRENLLAQSSYLIKNHPQEQSLSIRESEIIFLLIRGRTAKQIALALNLSNRTVEGYIDKLKNKFHSQNKAELIDKAISSGYLNHIPESLFTTQLSVILNEE